MHGLGVAAPSSLWNAATEDRRETRTMSALLPGLVPMSGSDWACLHQARPIRHDHRASRTGANPTYRGWLAERDTPAIGHQFNASRDRQAGLLTSDLDGPGYRQGDPGQLLAGADQANSVVSRRWSAWRTLRKVDRGRLRSGLAAAPWLQSQHLWQLREFPSPDAAEQRR